MTKLPICFFAHMTLHLLTDISYPPQMKIELHLMTWLWPTMIQMCTTLQIICLLHLRILT